MQESVLIPHLFRTEYRKIIAVLCKKFGFEHIASAEDLVSETFLLAAETWGQKGIPQNPAGWLYKVARNKAIDVVRRQKRLAETVPFELAYSAASSVEKEIDLSEQNIEDSQLQMMFAVCHPAISLESQVGLALNLLCGFGVEEIADAFLTNKEVIYKRLARAKEKLRAEQIRIELPMGSQMNLRLEAVLTTLYLLFSEGYYSASQNTPLRQDLCLEALRLNLMLTQNRQTNTPEANALLSLMCFHSSRFEARTGHNGEIILYEDQDTNLWNQELVDQGTYYLNRAARGSKLSRYHLEAAIAYWHTIKSDTAEKWENVLQLYNRLLIQEYSPMAALNRTYALAKARGNAVAIAEAEKLNLDDNHLYHALLGYLYTGFDGEKAYSHLHSALTLARNEADKKMIALKIDKLGPQA